MATATPKEPENKPNTNPSGASDEQLRKNEMIGKVRGQDVDPSHHVYEFTDPNTGEPVETHQVVHDVPKGVSKDGTLETEKATESYVKASGGEGGETKSAPPVKEPSK